MLRSGRCNCRVGPGVCSGVKVLLAALVAVVVFVLAAVVLIVAGAFAFRSTLGAARYRDLGLPAVVITAGALGGLAAGVLSFLRLRPRD